MCESDVIDHKIQGNSNHVRDGITDLPVYRIKKTAAANNGHLERESTMKIKTYTTKICNCCGYISSATKCPNCGKEQAK